MRQGKRGEARDRELGMGRAIDRRDFLNGAAIALGAALAGPAFGAAPAPQDQPGYYPPSLTGMRGSHPGSFEAAHRLRDGAPLSQAEGPVRTL
ncbi:MAG TPA: twin-arginine translocation signal domain-containing protein [Roseiarcus sp.]|nr:twin-arginine translocation signal domain-containing protein [Roseiarcus sp.]